MNGTSFRGPLTYNGKGGPEDDWFEKLPFTPNPDYFVFEDDFTGKAFDNSRRWNNFGDFNSGSGDLVESPSLGEGMAGGWIYLEGADETDASGSSIYTNSLYQVRAGTRIWYESRVVFDGESGDTAGECDFFVGIIPPTTLGGSGYLPWSEDTRPAVGLTLTGGSKRLYARSVETSGPVSGDVGVQSVDTGIDIEDGYVKDGTAPLSSAISNSYTLGFLINGDREIDFYVNRVKRATITQNLPTFAMGPAVAFESASATGQKRVYCDYIFSAFSRYPDGGNMTRYL